MSAPASWWLQSDRPRTEDLDPDTAPKNGESWQDLQPSKENAR
jgi:hypothetical protein